MAHEIFLNLVRLEWVVDKKIANADSPLGTEIFFKEYLFLPVQVFNSDSLETL